LTIQNIKVNIYAYLHHFFTFKGVVMRASNHPAKGSHITADPIRSERDIKNIKKLLADHPRNSCLFNFAINVNLRASDILKVKVGDVRGLQVGEHFTLKERKTGKERNITLNKTVHSSIQTLLGTMPESEDSDPLFKSRKGGHALCVQYFSGLVKKWCKQINLKGNYSAHSTRKTWGYQMRTVHNVDIPTLMTIYNHSSQKITLQYLGVQASEVKATYMLEI
jgi:integrase